MLVVLVGSVVLRPLYRPPPGVTHTRRACPAPSTGGCMVDQRYSSDFITYGRVNHTKVIRQAFVTLAVSSRSDAFGTTYSTVPRIIYIFVYTAVYTKYIIQYLHIYYIRVAGVLHYTVTGTRVRDMRSTVAIQ